MTSAPAVEMQAVDFSYNGHRVLEDVNCVLQPRDFVAVVGPNGGGKTTLLKLILGLLRPTRGTVRVLGEAPEKVRPRIGYVPQQFRYDPQFPATVGDVARTGLLGATGARGDLARLPATLEQVGLPGLALRPFHDLSGGQRQRVLIARALLASADMLLLDEPTAYVDAHGEDDLHDLLRRLSQDLTVIVVTHDFNFVSHLVNHVLCVNRRVSLHPTVGPEDVTAEVLRRMYGEDVRVVRHDVVCQPGECQH